MAKKKYIYLIGQNTTKHGKNAHVYKGSSNFNDYQYGDSIMVDSKYRFPTGKGMSTYGGDSDLYKDGRHVMNFDNGWDSYWGKAKIKDSKGLKKIKEQAERIKKYLDENKDTMGSEKERRFREALYSANMAMQYKRMKNRTDYFERKALARIRGKSGSVG